MNPIRHLLIDAARVSDRILKPELKSRLSALALLAVVWLAHPVAAHTQNTISTIAGGGTTPTNPLQADLPGPTSAVSLSGNTYIAAPNSAYVFKLSGGSLSNFAGIGWGGYSGDGGPATSANLALPNGLALDNKGNLYIADIGNSRVRMVDQNGNITTVAGNGTKCDTPTNGAACGDGGLAVNAELNFPTSVAIDSLGNIYIADAFDYRIREVTASTGIITTIAGNGTPCSNPTAACGDGAAATSANLNFAQGVAVDSSFNVYIADSKDHRIREVLANNQNILTFAGNGNVCGNPTASCGDGGAATSANLRSPAGVFVDSTGNVYIADTNDNRIREVPFGSANISTVAGSGRQDFSGDGGSPIAADLNTPTSVFIDSSTGNMLISDTGNQRIRTVSSNVINTTAGGGMGGDGGQALSATFANPYQLTEDTHANLYVADLANNRIRKINIGSGIVTTVAGTGVAGYTGDLGAALNATLNAPMDVKLDQNGNLYIADANNFVIRQVNGSTGEITTYAGTGIPCYPTTGKCGDGGLAVNAQFTFPTGIALDSAGNLYVADYNAHRIRRVDVNTGIITTVTGNGQGGFCCNPPKPAAQGILWHPSSVAVDGNGNLFISDSFNNLIRVVGGPQGGPLNCQAGYLCIYIGNGSACLCGDGGPVQKGSMWNPLELATDPSNNLFIGGGNDDVVQRADSVTQTWGTVAGVASSPTIGGFSGDGGPATLARMSNVGLTVDARQNLYIADAGNNRVRWVPLSPAITVPTNLINFGFVPLGSPSKAVNVPLQSTGGIDLTISNISFSGANPSDFSQTNNCGTLPASLGVDVKCTVSITFTPSGYSKRTATMTFTDNASPNQQSIPLSGSGPDFNLTSNMNAITIAQGSSGGTTLTLTPYGGFNQTVNLTVVNCPPGATCSVLPGMITLDGTHSQNASFTVQTTGSTPKGTYQVAPRGVFKTTQQTLLRQVVIKVTVD